MKRCQLKVSAFLLDDDRQYDLGDIHLFWDGARIRTWRWPYSPDKETGGVWHWRRWFLPGVETFDRQPIDRQPDEDWCMELTRTWYATADDAILYPDKVQSRRYAILYGISRTEPGAGALTEPGDPWVSYVEPLAGSKIESGLPRGGLGLGLFDEKKNSIRNPATGKMEHNWFLPPSGAHRLFWRSTPWSEPKHPYPLLFQEDNLLRRRGEIARDKNESKRYSIPPDKDLSVPMPKPLPRKR